ncbi:MAG TPA: hypothetical protein VF510_12295 [Ktedonobacterales bacterium]
MSGDDNDRPGLTVGSLLGVPLGATASTPESGEVTPPVSAPAQVSGVPGEALTTAELPWTLANGRRGPRWNGPQFRGDGVEVINYNNVFDQGLEMVWFDGKIVYALDLGEVDVDPARVKVAQEYQIVYAVELDEHGKTKSEPQRVPEQLNIYDSVPGIEKYSPIWQFDYVVVPPDYTPNTLRSEADCLSSGFPIYRSQVFEN